MASTRSFTSFASMLAVLPSVMAGFDASSSSNVAVYWGQNSYGQGTGDLAQQDLSTYCQNADIDVIALAFANGITPAINNFANSGNACTAFADNANLLNCPTIASDITTCQAAGTTIILSLGGATYTQAGWSSTADAEAAAQLVWDMYGPAGDASVDRPFGDVVVDGFDFDFETTTSNIGAFGSKLRSLMDAAHSGGSKYFYLSAAPQCPYPDAADDPALNGGVFFDFVMVQFYNNYCGVSSFVTGGGAQTAFNIDTWDTWAKGSANPDAKVLLGIPANTGAGGGYTSGTQLADAITYSKQYSSFGGVMMWDMSQLYANTGFLAEVVSDLS